MSDWKPDPLFKIETPRVIISHLLPDDNSHCEFIVALYNSPLFIADSGKTGVDTPAIAQRFINGRVKGLHSKYGYGIYLVSLKEDSRPIGIVSLVKGDAIESFPAPDVGFAFLPEATGKGYATEAARALLDYAGNELGVKEVFAFCKPHNAKSRGVMERLGMEYRGVKKLKMFGSEESAVYVLAGMKELADYGIGENQIAE